MKVVVPVYNTHNINLLAMVVWLSAWGGILQTSQMYSLI